MKNRSIREKLNNNEFICAIGIGNALEAKLVEAAGFDCIYMTGYGVVAENFGMPDIGLVTMSEMAETARRIANATTLPVIADADKPFWGYSDLTTVINAIYTMTGQPSVLWQIKNMVYSEAGMQRKRFRDHLSGDSRGLFGVSCSFLQGERMEGVVVGGNIRCFTKLAGTKYWPDMNGKILLLESLGGGSGQVATMFAQLEQIGVFDQVAGVLLGTFTNYEKSNLGMTVYDLLKMHIDEGLPVAATGEIGHGHDSKAIVIGKETVFE